MDKIKAYRKLIPKGLPGPVMEYFYLTKVDGADWVADISDEAAEGWGDEFEWDDDPCGSGIDPEDMSGLLAEAQEIGYIDSETKKLIITEQWNVPVGYAYIDGRTVVTTWELVGKGVE